jgi:hypothetical protein
MQTLVPRAGPDGGRKKLLGAARAGSLAAEGSGRGSRPVADADLPARLRALLDVPPG